MDILIRNVNPKIIYTIDDLAKNKNISRNDYILEIFEKFYSSVEIKEVEDKYLNLIINYLIPVIKENTNIIEKLGDRL